jgi:HSP20 family protein
MSNLVRFDPWGMMRDLDRLFEEGGRSRYSDSGWMPRLDVFERDANLVIRAEVPGVDADDIDVTLEAGTLTITGSRSFEKDEEIQGGFHRKEIFEGLFKRTVLLPEGTDADAVSASTKDGILEVTVPKKPEVLPRKVTVDVQR